MHRYSFPSGAQANVLIDLGAVIQVDFETPGEYTGASIGGYVEWISERELLGRADLRGGWGHIFPYSVYFYAAFDRPAPGRLVADSLGPVPKIVASGAAAGHVPPLLAVGPRCKALASFDEAGGQVVLRTGISYVSVANAHAAVERELGSRDFEAVRAEALATWDRALGRIRVEGGTDAQRTLFYTLYTRLLCMPSDLGTDENPLWRSDVRQFTDLYALWDSVRNANALITLFDPDLEAALLACLLDIADHTGRLPDAWIAGHSAMVQGGSSAAILFCEAALKGLQGIDYERALAYLRKDAEEDPDDPWLHGRYLADYRDRGYVSTSVPRGSVSRHLEYAYHDWCIGTLAAYLGHDDLARAYRAASRRLWNLWRADLRAFAPRRPDGSWQEPFDPTSHLPMRHLDPYFYEGNSLQWSFSTHHDFAGLVARHGGPELFVRHLDRFFAAGHYTAKETQLHIPYLYTYAGRPDRTAERVWEYLARYRPARDGLLDNEDMGAQSAWYMCSALGLYPIMGQDMYLLSTPIFERTEVALGADGARLTIEAPGAGPDRPYIASAMLTGRPLERAWVRHDEIAVGATLWLQLATTPTAWGRGMPPPSPLEDNTP